MAPETTLTIGSISGSAPTNINLINQSPDIGIPIPPSIIHQNTQILNNPFSSIPNINITNLIPIKLNKDDLLTWQSLFLPVMKGYNLLGHVDGSSVCPPSLIPSSTTINPEFLKWNQLDQLLLMWMNATISEAYLPYVIGITTARDLWIALERHFASLSRSHILQLRARLQSIRKGSSSITTYLQQIKEIADSLAAAGNPIYDLDMVFYILNGLPPDYNSFSTSIRVREPAVNSDELHSLLLTEELTINSRSQMQVSEEHNAFYTSYRQGNSTRSDRGSGYNSNRGRGRGRNPPFNQPSYTPPSFYPQPSNTFASNSHTQVPFFHPPSNSAPSYAQHQNMLPFTASKPVCQICGKPNHSALDCYNRMNYAYVGRQPPQKLKAMVAQRDQASAASISSPTPWILDTGATNHVTMDVSNLQTHTPYVGFEKLCVGNGDSLSIQNTGSCYGEDSFSRFS